MYIFGLNFCVNQREFAGAVKPTYNFGKKIEGRFAFATNAKKNQYRS
jgi:hypothetical protein